MARTALAVVVQRELTARMEQRARTVQTVDVERAAAAAVQRLRPQAAPVAMAARRVAVAEAGRGRSMETIAAPVAMAGAARFACGGSSDACTCTCHRRHN